MDEVDYIDELFNPTRTTLNNLASLIMLEEMSGHDTSVPIARYDELSTQLAK